MLHRSISSIFLHCSKNFAKIRIAPSHMYPALDKAVGGFHCLDRAQALV